MQDMDCSHNTWLEAHNSDNLVYNPGAYVTDTKRLLAKSF